MPVKLSGSTSGTVTITAPAVAGTNTVTLPAATGTLIVDNGAGALVLNTLTSNSGVGLTLQGAGITGTFIDTSGNVGFGTTTPAPYKVNVVGTSAFTQQVFPNNVVTVTANAGTVPIAYRLSTFTNSSAAGMTITMATSGAVDGQIIVVRVYDFSAVGQVITWVNTENSGVTVPTTSNGSTTLPRTVGFMYNNATSKWRCIASA